MTKKKKPEDKEKAGRPTDYKPEYAKQVFKLCLLGAKDDEIAKFFEVSQKTVNRRKKDHLEFWQSIIEGKETADLEVAHSIYKRAKGMVVKKKEVVKLKVSASKEVYEIVEYDQELPPDMTAAQYRMNNRRPKKRKNKHEISGDPDNPIKLQIPNVTLVLNKPKNDKPGK